MNNILILGAGLVAGPLVEYLLKTPGFFVVLTDMEPEKPRKMIAGHPNGKAMELDIQNDVSLRNAIAKADLVISMVPNTFHPVVAKATIDLGKPMLTASYVTPDMHVLDDAARKKGVLILNELGLDPGIDHMEAMRIIRDVKSRGGQVSAFTSYCGGLPAPDSNNNPFGYKFSWSPRGVLLASKSSARYFKDGQEAVIPARELFANPASIVVPNLGTFEGYPNRDSVPYREIYGIPEAETVLRGTLRYPGWCRTLKTISEMGYLDEEARDLTGSTFRRLTETLLGAEPGADIAQAAAAHLDTDIASDVLERLEWLGLYDDKPLPFDHGSPLDNLVALMTEKLKYAEGERDMILLQHEFLARSSDGKQEKIISTLVDYGLPGGYSSMSKTVGLPVALAAKLVLKGRIQKTGVQIPVFPEIYGPILEELKTLGIGFQEDRRYL